MLLFMLPFTDFLHHFFHVSLMMDDCWHNKFSLAVIFQRLVGSLLRNTSKR